jgi:hypothetical protein
VNCVAVARVYTVRTAFDLVIGKFQRNQACVVLACGLQLTNQVAADRPSSTLDQSITWSITMNRILNSTLAGAVLASLSLSAEASTISATFDSMTPQSNVTVSYPNTTTSTSAGRFNFTRTGGNHPQTPLPDSPASKFWAFCVELGQTISFGQNVTFDVTALEMGGTSMGGIGSARADDLRELLGAVYPDFSQTLSNDGYAALQIAIWEITRENAGVNGYDVYAGDVKFSGSNATILNLANTFLDNVDGSGPRAKGISALVSQSRQDMLVQFPVPEPGTLGLALIGIGAMLGARRRAAA